MIIKEETVEEMLSELDVQTEPVETGFEKATEEMTEDDDNDDL